MRNFLLGLFIVAHLSQTYCRTSQLLKIPLSHGGILIGRYMTSYSGKGIRGFLGVPYAEKPVGEQRFKDPVPYRRWIGEMLVINEAQVCSQRDSNNMKIIGCEDCLYLNVYTPFPSETELLPVMIYFHGGGWTYGSANPYGPEFLLDHKIILVTANYRLGPLGFLSAGHDDCHGNFGLKDQVQVLKWVHRNIRAFHGDRSAVTIAGHSSGAASVTYHMMSPLSKGLFKQAISMSGTNLNPWAQPNHPGIAESRAAKLGTLLGCPKNDENSELMYACLRNVPAENITAANFEFYEWDMDPISVFQPVIERESPRAFIPKHPRNVTNPHGLSIPLLMGILTDEGAGKAAAIYENDSRLDNLNNNWQKALEISLYYSHHSDAKKKQITDRINDFYFRNHKLEPDTLQNFTNMYTDGLNFHGFDEYLRNRLDDANREHVAPTFVYLFNHKGPASHTEEFTDEREDYYGVAHGDELQFLFPINKYLAPTAVPTANDLRLRNIFVRMMVNFVQTGNPTPENHDNIDLVQWTPTTHYPVDYLRIGNKGVEHRPVIAMESTLMPGRANFWMELGAHLSTKKK